MQATGNPSSVSIQDAKKEPEIVIEVKVDPPEFTCVIGRRHAGKSALIYDMIRHWRAAGQCVQAD
jgi:ABC-type cobalamin/Fe3+-siderophores transport system ATPase subunit